MTGLEIKNNVYCVLSSSVFFFFVRFVSVYLKKKLACLKKKEKKTTTMMTMTTWMTKKTNLKSFFVGYQYTTIIWTASDENVLFILVPSNTNKGYITTDGCNDNNEQQRSTREDGKIKKQKKKKKVEKVVEISKRKKEEGFFFLQVRIEKVTCLDSCTECTLKGGTVSFVVMYQS